ncbi:hypothetical protein KIPB_002042 [Kipferlia bialata]|uniref:Uncharacterized protein n=1 Tax=Kipferlia bialata TaxID=797122 RepID=A0A9K3GFL5_9EUKA|nr:hypothetical protein KIPB_002042 [Kipferlia bialata]|eukprot:g2042.t1
MADSMQQVTSVGLQLVNQVASYSLEKETDRLNTGEGLERDRVTQGSLLRYSHHGVSCLAVSKFKNTALKYFTTCGDIYGLTFLVQAWPACTPPPDGVPRGVGRARSALPSWTFCPGSMGHTA